MKDIIICGYPKSGNTWITRLVAELVGCPVAGFWGSNHREIAIEGEDRVSEFSCYKSHHQLSELLIEKDFQGKIIIYVVRDPRDIVISGANFFYFSDFKMRKLIRKLPYPDLWCNIIISIIRNEKYRINKMVNTVLFGDNKVHYWCRIPWKDHYRTFAEDDFFFVKYESMLNDPYAGCCNLLQHIGISRSRSVIERSILNQSFCKKKQDFIESGYVDKAKFLRVGKSKQWEGKLSRMQNEKFENMIGDDLKYFNY